MVNEIKKIYIERKPNFHNHCLKEITRWILLECRDGSCYVNTQKVEFTLSTTKNKTKQKNYES